MIDHYAHMMRDIEKDCVDYIMGLWHMHRIAKMVQNKKGK